MGLVLSIRVLPRRGVSFRAALATLEIMTVLVAAHTWAGGQLPSVTWMALAGGLVFAAGTVVLRGRVPIWAMVPALAVTHLLLHCWMVVLAPASHGGAHSHGPHLDLTWQMVLAHVVGALATALVWELRRRAVDVVLTWAETGLVPVPSLRAAPPRRDPLLPMRRPLVVVPLRGPPAALLAA
jgi:hypothetical protein